MLDFNRVNVSATALSVAINQLIEAAEPPEENIRRYLGASSVGQECLRRIQYDWMCDAEHPTRLRDIFARGHFFEEVSRQHLIRAGATYSGRAFSKPSCSISRQPFSRCSRSQVSAFVAVLPFDAARAQEASDRAVAVIQATQAGELLPRVTDDAGDWRCKICGHRERCWK